MNSNTVRLVSVCVVIPVLGVWTSVVNAAVTLDGSPYSQNFDSLSVSGTAWQNDSTIPGWSLFKRPAPGTPITTIMVGAGGSNTGAFYSFGTDGSEDRALGGVGSGGNYWSNPASGAVAGWITAHFSNDTGSTVESFTVSYDGEQWRYGGNTNQQTMVFEYGFGSSFDSVTWTPPGGSFDFTSPIAGSGPSVLDGNAAENRVAGLGGTISGLSWVTGESLWVRWIENNDTGNDHGLAIDNFSINTTQSGGGTELAGDYNGDNVVDAADYTVWQDKLGSLEPLPNETLSLGVVDNEDYDAWKLNYGAVGGAGGAAIGATTVPEPASYAICFATATLVTVSCRLRWPRT